MKDELGRVVLPPAFEALGWSDGNFSVIGEVTGYRLQGSWGIVNLKKEFITKADFESLIYSGGDCIIARKKINQVFSKSGCINSKGEIKIPFIYDGINVQGLRSVVFNLKGPHYYFGLSDLDNRILIPLVYKNIRPLGTLRFAVENSQNKIALFNDEGKPVTDFSIDSVSVFYQSFAIVYQDHLQGLINREGTIKLETKYNAIQIREDGEVSAKLPNEWLFINEKNEVGKLVLADELKPINEKRFVIQKGNAFGLADLELKTLVPIEFDHLSEIVPGKYLAKRNKKFGVVTEKNEQIISFSYDSLIRENNLYRAYKRNFGWQLLNPVEKELTEKYYEQLLPSNQLGLPVTSKGFSGVVNFEGHEFIHCVFDSIAQPIDGLMTVKFKGKYGIINANEDWLVAPQAYPLCVINEHRYLQRQPGNNFIKTFAGEILYFSPYRLKFNKENFVESLPDGVEKTVSYDGEIVQRSEIPEGVKEIFSESEGLRGIRKDDRYGFVDQRGRLVIANRYDSIGEFHDGLAAVKLIGKWGFVNASDQIVINPNYDNSSSFQNDLAVVSRNGKFGLIRKTGEIVLPLRYDKIKRLLDHKFLIIAASFLGLADELGNVLIEPRFDSLSEASNDLLIVCRDRKCGAITDHGLSIVPMIYDRLSYISSQKSFLAERKSEWKKVDIKH